MPWIVVVAGVVAVLAAVALGVRRSRPERSTAASGKPLMLVGILFLTLSGVFLFMGGPDLYAVWVPLGVVFVAVGASQMASKRETHRV